jgi:hypothetical protein
MTVFLKGIQRPSGKTVEIEQDPAGWPVRELIYGYHRPKAELNFDNVTNPGGTPPIEQGNIPFGNRNCDDTINSWIEWYVSLMAGTYALAFSGFSYSGSGILTFALNGTNINSSPYNASSATLDTYAAGSGNAFYQQEVCSNLVIPTSKVYVLRATVTGKNASSSGYATVIDAIALNRIGA